MYVSPHGQAAGLPERLDKWVNDLSRDSRYPWAGLGLIADLKASAALLRGEPIPNNTEEPALVPGTEATLEFDL
jgi:hypothetical protein